MARTYWDWDESELHAGIANIQTQLTLLTGVNWIGVKIDASKGGDSEAADKGGDGDDELAIKVLADEHQVKAASDEKPEAEVEGGPVEETALVTEGEDGLVNGNDGTAGATGGAVITGASVTTVATMDINELSTTESMFEGDSQHMYEEYTREQLKANIKKVKAKLRELGVVGPEVDEPVKKRGKLMKGCMRAREEVEPSWEPWKRGKLAAVL
ncbi:uncharacterized protein LTR77_004688 [Saxophila tyrrhenica]|uniref:Uncharacterized protein n=1 Tax=Saxophila tyrrhenica TaxID=1690608 RepID=A0AAV9PC60_9PEZI|nr:hypothetical protein LTR77_004688 [Saxophila tyrrhenica]